MGRAASAFCLGRRKRFCRLFAQFSSSIISDKCNLIFEIGGFAVLLGFRKVFAAQAVPFAEAVICLRCRARRAFWCQAAHQ